MCRSINIFQRYSERLMPFDFETWSSNFIRKSTTTTVDRLNHLGRLEFGNKSVWCTWVLWKPLELHEQHLLRVQEQIWKCNQSSWVSCLPVYNSYYKELTGKRMELSISNCTRYSTHQDFRRLWVAFWWWFLGWRHRLQRIVIVRSFLRLLKLHKLTVGKLDLSRGGSYYVSWCVRPWIKFTPEHPFHTV